MEEPYRKGKQRIHPGLEFCRRDRDTCEQPNKEGQPSAEAPPYGGSELDSRAGLMVVPTGNRWHIRSGVNGAPEETSAASPTVTAIISKTLATRRCVWLLEHFLLPAIHSETRYF